LWRREATETALGDVRSIPRDGDDPVFPAPWAATAFAMTVALHERGLFTWAEWAERLGRAIADAGEDSDPEAYWHCWLAALEDTVTTGGIAAAGALGELQAAWRHAASATPHGEPIVLSEHVNDVLVCDDDN
jgi:nitrile hydratase accessory protein